MRVCGERGGGYTERSWGSDGESQSGQGSDDTQTHQALGIHEFKLPRRTGQESTRTHVDEGRDYRAQDVKDSTAYIEQFPTIDIRESTCH